MTGNDVSTCPNQHKPSATGQNTWYDKHARLRSFEPGDKVLVLLPTDTSKFLAQWKGPYPVVKRVSDVLHEVDMIGTQKRNCIFHAHQHAEEVE